MRRSARPRATGNWLSKWNRLALLVRVAARTGTVLVRSLAVVVGMCLMTTGAVAQEWEVSVPFETDAALPLSFMMELTSTDAGFHTAHGVRLHLHQRILPFVPEVRAAVGAGMTHVHSLVGEALNSAEGYRASEPAIWTRRGHLDMPIEGASLAAGFGERRRDHSTTLERHTGWSLHATASSEVESVARGVVVFAEPVSGLGFTVVIAHDTGLHTVYAGLLSLAVRPWQSLAAGETVGLGVAESASGRRELYFEVREAGVPVDPDLWLR
jgi:hypothetical protein